MSEANKIRVATEVEGHHVWGYWVRGHVDHEEFVSRVRTEFDEERIMLGPCSRYGRVVPYGDDSILTFGDKPGRGAFPVTYVEVA